MNWKTNPTKSAKKWLSLVSLSLLLSPLSSHSAGTDIANIPLFALDAVESNVYFLMDDSGSMEWEVLVQDGSSGIPHVAGGYFNYYLFSVFVIVLKKSTVILFHKQIP